MWRKFLTEWLPLGMIAGFGLFLAYVLFKPSAGESIALDTPPFALVQMEAPDNTITLSDLQGAPKLVHVWATWCKVCLQEHHWLVEHAADFDHPIIGLNYHDEWFAAQNFLSEVGNPYQMSVFDPNGELGFHWGVIGTPETLVLNSQAQVKYRHRGPIDFHVYESILKPQLQAADAEVS